MNLKEYQERALLTAMFPLDQAIPYCTLGLCGEIAEVLEKEHGLDFSREDVQAEIGDVVWYCAVLAHHCGITLQDELLTCLDYGDSHSGAMAEHAGLIANKAKKKIRDNRDLDPVFVYNHIQAILYLVNEYAEAYGLTLSEVLTANIEKLSSRQERGVIVGSGDKR